MGRGKKSFKSKINNLSIYAFDSLLLYTGELLVHENTGNVGFLYCLFSNTDNTGAKDTPEQCISKAFYTLNQTLTL